MNRKSTRKKYEPIKAHVIKFQTEDVLSGSGFFGEEEELGENTVNINSDYTQETQSQVNPT